jgi:hypothetical protein
LAVVYLLTLISASLAMMIPHLHSPGPSLSLVQTEETPENKERDPEPAAEEDIQMEYSSDWL